MSATLAKVSSSAASGARPGRSALVEVPWSGLAWPGGGEEVDEELVDAVGFVVVDPVGGVGQAFDAVQVGDVVVAGLGELGARVVARSSQMTRVGAAMGRSAASAFFGDSRTENR